MATAPRWTILSAVLAVAAAFSACGSFPPTNQDPAAFESVFPVLARLRVTTFRDQDWCKNLAYARGAYSDTTAHSTCDLFPNHAVAFDAAALVDFDEVRRTFADAGVRPIYALIEYSDAGTITEGVFEVACSGCEIGRYIYESGRVRTSAVLVPGASEAILTPTWSWYEER